MAGVSLATRGPGAYNNYSSTYKPTTSLAPKLPATTAAPTDQYGNLMSQYTDLLNTPASSVNLSDQYSKLLTAPSSFNPVAPTTTNYTTDPAYVDAINNLKTLSSTGGYSSQDIADLRARAVSPVQSVYAGAQRNIERAKALQGGYSPNYTAATAKLTRGLSDATSSAIINANAGIAQNVASNKLQIAPQYASAAGSANAARTAIEQNNAAAINRGQEINSQGQTQAQQFDIQTKQNILQSLLQLYRSGTGDKLAILEAMRQLYGQQASLGLQNKGLDNAASSTLINAYRS